MLGFKCVQGDHTGTASNLADYIVQTVPSPSRLLYLMGDKRRDVLPNQLVDSGYQLDQIQAYETGPNPNFGKQVEAIEESAGQIQWIVFFSPSGFDVALETLQARRNISRIQIASIGPTTTNHILEKGYQVSAQAQHPTPKSLADAIAAQLCAY
jgi:uroporphyrinogen-III synthase